MVDGGTAARRSTHMMSMYSSTNGEYSRLAAVESALIEKFVAFLPAIGSDRMLDVVFGALATAGAGATFVSSVCFISDVSESSIQLLLTAFTCSLLGLESKATAKVCSC